MPRGSDAAIFRPLPRPDADHVLVCLSYCGGGTAPYRPWAAAVPENVDLALVCYPGRETRFGEPFARDWTALRDDVVRTVAGLTDRPYTVFGHSMGSWVAFEAVVELHRLGYAPPTALVLSGGVAARTRWVDRGNVPRSGESDEALARWMREFGQISEEVAAEPDLLHMAQELLRADLGVAESYWDRPHTPVTVPVPMRVLYGAEDTSPFVEVEQGWRARAAGAFEAFELPGGHFYTDDVWSRLPEWCLRQPSGAPGADR